MKFLCKIGLHKWMIDGSSTNVFRERCERCLVRRKSSPFSDKLTEQIEKVYNMGAIMVTRIPKRYYREWLSCHGWGVMVSYDTTWAKSQKEAAKGEPRSAYTHWSVAENSPLGYYECVIKVRDEHLDLTEQELSKIYGHKETE